MGKKIKNDEDKMIAMASKIFNEFGVKIPKIEWAFMEYEELEEIYKDLQNNQETIVNNNEEIEGYLIEGYSLDEIKQVTSEILLKIIRNNTPYKWVFGEEPYINIFGKLIYDYSGDVVKMSISDLDEIINDKEDSDDLIIYDSELERILSSIYINSWYPTYCSGYGKRYYSYYELLQNEFDNWCYENIYPEEVVDEDGNYTEIYKELESKLSDVFYIFLKNTPIDNYYEEIVNSIRDIER